MDNRIPSLAPARSTIFLSHAVKDRVLSRAMKKLLELHQLRVFHSEFDIPSGENFAEVILRNIEQAEVILCLLTPAYAESHWCQSEAGIAAFRKAYARSGQNECKLVLFVLEPFSKSKGEVFAGVFRGRQFLTLRNAGELIGQLGLAPPNTRLQRSKPNTSNNAIEDAASDLNRAIKDAVSYYTAYQRVMEQRQSCYWLSSLANETEIIGVEIERIIREYQNVRVLFVGASLKYSKKLVEKNAKRAIEQRAAQTHPMGQITLECYALERTELLRQLGALRDLEEISRGSLLQSLKDIGKSCCDSAEWERDRTGARMELSKGGLQLKLLVYPIHVLPSIPGVFVAGWSASKSCATLFAGECVMRPRAQGEFELIVGENPYSVHRSTNSDWQKWDKDWPEMSDENDKESKFDAHRIAQFLHGTAYLRSLDAHPRVAAVLTKEDLYKSLEDIASLRQCWRTSDSNEPNAPPVEITFIATSLRTAQPMLLKFALNGPTSIEVFICSSGTGTVHAESAQTAENLARDFIEHCEATDKEKFNNVSSRINVFMHRLPPTMRVVYINQHLCAVFPYRLKNAGGGIVTIDRSVNIGFLARQGDSTYGHLEGMVKGYVSVLREYSRHVLEVKLENGRCTVTPEDSAQGAAARYI